MILYLVDMLASLNFFYRNPSLKNPVATQDPNLMRPHINIFLKYSEYPRQKYEAHRRRDVKKIALRDFIKSSFQKIFYKNLSQVFMRSQKIFLKH